MSASIDGRNGPYITPSPVAQSQSHNHHSPQYLFVKAYLDAHKLPESSWQYAYIFWLLIAAFALISTICTLCSMVFSSSPTRRAPQQRISRCDQRPHGSRLSNINVVFSRAATWSRRKLWYAHLPTSLWGGRGATPTPVRSLLPSLTLWIIILLLTVIGADYTDPNKSAWDLSSAFPRGGTRWFPPSNSTPVTTTPPATELNYRTWWTVGDRLGLLLNALTPLAVILSVRQVPLAVFSLRFVGGWAFDRLARIHGHVGWLMWALATSHTVTWLIQLGRDRYPISNPDSSPHAPQRSKSALRAALVYPRFRWAIVSYIFLTLMCFLSLPPIRRRWYPVFYVSHVVCIPGFLITGALHHPPLGPWLWAALTLWLTDRLARALKGWYINFPAASREDGQVNLRTQQESEEKAAHSSSRRFDVSGSVCDLPKPATAATATAHSPQMLMHTSASSSKATLTDSNMALSQGKLIQAQPKSDVKRGNRADLVSPARASSSGKSAPSFFPIAGEASSRPTDAHQVDGKSTPSNSPASQIYMGSPPPVPLNALRPGWAVAQILPGHLVRLTLLTARPLPSCSEAGQWISLSLPQISSWQARPLTIASLVDASVSKCVCQQTNRGHQHPAAKRGNSIIVLLIRARKGLTNDLYQYVAQARAKVQVPPPRDCSDAQEVRFTNSSASTGFGRTSVSASSVYLRSWVDGPYGSSSLLSKSERYATVIIVCAGSGVAHGIATLQSLAQQQSATWGKSWGRHGNSSLGSAMHIHFVWIMRDLAHLTWAASILRQCIESYPPQRVRVDLFVTRPASGQRTDLHPLRSTTGESLARHDQEQEGSQAADRWEQKQTHHSDGGRYLMDMEAAAAFSYQTEAPTTPTQHAAPPEDDHMLTEFEGEETTPYPADQRLANTLHLEGAMRKERTLRSFFRRKGEAFKRQSRRDGSHPCEPSSPASHPTLMPRMGSRAPSNSSSESHSEVQLYELGGSAHKRNQHELRRAEQEDSVRQVQQALYDQAHRRRVADAAGAGENDGEKQEGRFTISPRDYTPPGPGTGMTSSRALTTPESEQTERQEHYHEQHDTQARHSALCRCTHVGPSSHSTPPHERQHLDLTMEEEDDARVLAELVRFGRPDLKHLILSSARRCSSSPGRDEEEGAGQQEVQEIGGPTFVSACGPPTLAHSVQRASAQANDPTLPYGRGTVTVEVERFGWGG